MGTGFRPDLTLSCKASPGNSPQPRSATSQAVRVSSPQCTVLCESSPTSILTGSMRARPTSIIRLSDEGGTIVNQRTVLMIATIVPCLGASLSTAALAQQSPFGTQAEAKSMFDKAIAALKTDKIKALTLFNSGEGAFRDRDLYVFCFNSKTGIFDAQVVKTLLGTDIR